MTRLRPPRSAAIRAGAVGLGVFALLSTAVAALAQTPPRRARATRTIVELVADRQPDAATREAWLGLRFELEQGWHIYWQNPGDSGGPPTVLWQPAPGVTLGDFEWPTPERIPLGPLMNFGYNNEIVLPFRVQFAKPLTGTPVRVGGTVKYLICHDVCIPAQTSVSIALPLAPEDQPHVAAWKQAIAAARARVPKPLPAAWKARAQTVGDQFVLTLTLDRSVTAATFFPLEVSQVDNAAPQGVEVKGRELVMRLKKSAELEGTPGALRGVLVLGAGEAFTIDTPLAAAPR